MGKADFTSFGPKKYEIKFSHNPFLTPKDGELTISNFPIGSTIKIMDLKGRVLRTLQNHSFSEYSWDGKDNNGNYILIDLEHVKNFKGEYYNLQNLDEIIGTNKYAAPEIYKNPSLAGPTSDVYSLGKIFYLIIARKFPDELDTDWNIISKKIPELEDCIISMLNHDHHLRPTIFEVERKINNLEE